MAGTDTGVDAEKDGSSAAKESQDMQDTQDLAGLEAGLDALDSAQAGRTPPMMAAALATVPGWPAQYPARSMNWRFRSAAEAQHQ
jgi:NitT/TauT family transport system permease protein